MATTVLSKPFPDTRQVWNVISMPSTKPVPSTKSDPFTHDRKCELLIDALMKKKSIGIPWHQGRYFAERSDIDSIRRLIVKDTFGILLSKDPWHEYVLGLVESWRSQVEPESLISRISTLPNLMHAERISNRLSYLRRVFFEELGSDISADSIRTFTIFLSMHPDVRYPAITLTPAGNIYAQWKKRKDSYDSLFSLHFLSDWEVRFVVFAPNAKHLGKFARISGTEAVDTILSNMDKAYGVSAWVIE